MLTPKHRALFAAAYATQLLKSTNDDNELASGAVPPLDPSTGKSDEPGETEHKP